MAEKVKKAPAKPKTTTEKAKAVPAKLAEAAPPKPLSVPAKVRTTHEKAAAGTPSKEQIAQLAHKYWAERGRHHGSHEQDWLRAERELRGMAS